MPIKRLECQVKNTFIIVIIITTTINVRQMLLAGKIDFFGSLILSVHRDLE